MKAIKKILKTIGKVLLALVLVVLVGVGGLLAYLTGSEYKPAERESLSLLDASGGTSGSSTGTAGNVTTGEALTVLSWNMGYGGLSKTADFFMDGGQGVRTQDEASVRANVAAVEAEVLRENADVVFLQEVDVSSTRTYRINEVETLREALSSYQSAFANNFKVAFIPYPIPPIGKVDSGILTLTKFQATSAERVQLPCPFSWPIRLGNLKRCLLVERTPVEGTDKELVLINLHLEAYDDGEGKIAQTRMLAELMQQEADKGNYVIAGGDFNQSFSSVDTSMYPLQGGDLWECGEIDVTQFRDTWQFLMDTATPTCRSLDRPYDSTDSTFQFYMIDGFIVSDNIEVTTMETIDLGFENSDHNPIKMVVTLKP